MKLFLSAALALCSFAVYAQQMPAYLPNLKKEKITVLSNEQILWGYDASTTKVLNKPCATVDAHWACIYGNQDEIEDEKVLATINNESLAISYRSDVMSGPTFSIVDKNKKVLKDFIANEFYISGGNIIYTANQYMETYNKKSKYTIKGNQIVEEKQPMHYVGMQTKTTKAITLYKTKTGKEVLANLTPNYNIEVLMEDTSNATANSGPRYFLVKTDFGLVGWLQITELHEPGIEGLRLLGN